MALLKTVHGGEWANASSGMKAFFFLLLAPGFFYNLYSHMSRDMTNQQNACAPSEDSDQPGHPPSLIRVFAFRIKKALVLSYPLSAQ